MNAPSRIPASEAARILAAEGLKKRDRIEDKIQQSFAEWCRLALRDDVLFFAISNEAGYENAAHFARMGMQVGAADFCVIHNSYTYFIEFKRPKSKGKKAGAQSEDQRAFQRRAEMAGAFYFIARSSVEAINFLSRHGVPHREKRA